MSKTVTVKLHVEVLFDASVAVKISVVTPTGNVAPLAKPLVLAIVGEAVQLSVAVTLNVATAPQTPGALLILRGVGQVMTGFSLSKTVTVKLAVELLLLSSVTVKVLRVIPTGNVEPLGKPLVWVMLAPEQVFVKEAA